MASEHEQEAPRIIQRRLKLGYSRAARLIEITTAKSRCPLLMTVDVNETSGDVNETSGDVNETSGDVNETSGDVNETSGDVKRDIRPCQRDIPGCQRDIGER
jgi:DNA segregation ATPase FtsK/SpoIIIE-like protein